MRPRSRFTWSMLLIAAGALAAGVAGSVSAQPGSAGSRTFAPIPGSVLIPPYGSVTFSTGASDADLPASSSLEVDSDTPEPVTASYAATGPASSGGNMPGLLTLTAPDGAIVQVQSGCQPQSAPAQTVSCPVAAMRAQGSGASIYLTSKVWFMTLAAGTSLPPGSCPLPIPPASNTPPPGPPGTPGVPVCDARYLGIGVAGFCKPPPRPLAAAAPESQGLLHSPGSFCLTGSGTVTFYPPDVQLPADSQGPPDDSTPHLTVTGQGGLFTTVSYDAQGLLIASPGGSVIVTSASDCIPSADGYSVVSCPDVTLDPPSSVSFVVDMASGQQPGRVTYAPGWNLVAGPAGTILLGLDGPLYTLDPSAPSAGYTELPSRTPLRAGGGYWAYFDGTTSSPFPSVPAQSTLIPLPAGQWVLAGNPLSIEAAASGADALLIYDPVTAGYRPATTLYPGQGALAYSAAGGTLSLDPAP